MAKKTWKLGEVCKGGVVTIETTKSKVTVIGKEWDYSQGSNRGSNQSNAKEFDRLTVSVTDEDARRKVNNFLNELTTSYYSDELIKWVETKIEFKSYSLW